MQLIVHLVVGGLSVLITSYLLPGVHVGGFLSAVIAAVVLSLANLVIRPVLLLLTLPINILTLGLFTFVVNAMIILLVSFIVPGFKVDGFWWALLFSLILSVVGTLLNTLFN